MSEHMLTVPSLRKSVLALVVCLGFSGVGSQCWLEDSHYYFIIISLLL